MAVAASLDLNTLHNLSRTCRAVRLGLLQYRSSLVTHTLHCVNEDVEVDPDDTFRYRARAGNWFYMRDDAQGDRYNGKSGSCARDMVDGCRRCGNVVCRVRLSRSRLHSSLRTEPWGSFLRARHWAIENENSGSSPRRVAHRATKS